MKNRLPRISKYFIAAVFLAGNLVSLAAAQPANPLGREVRISAAGGRASFPDTCLQVDKMVYNEETLKKLLAFEQCSKMLGGSEIDLKKETLIGWQAASDCHMHVETKLYRNDREKLFTLVINNFYGGCRAGGWRQGLFAIDKIPSDYKFRFIEYQIDDLYNKTAQPSLKSEETWTADGQKIPSAPPASANEPKAGNSIVTAPVESLETREVDLKGCLRAGNMSSYESVIRDDETFQKAIGDNARYDACRKNLEKIDFSKHSLLGMYITSDYCDRPHGLEYKTLRDDAKKLYTLQVSYTDPRGSLCRRIGHYDLWVLVPKMPDGYKAAFDLRMITPKTN